MYEDGDATKVINEMNWKTEYNIESKLQDLLNYWLKKLKD